MYNCYVDREGWMSRPWDLCRFGSSVFFIANSELSFFLEYCVIHIHIPLLLLVLVAMRIKVK